MKPSDYTHHVELSIEECGLIAEAMAFFQAHGYPCQTNWRVVHRPPMERLQELDRSLGEKIHNWLEHLCSKYHLNSETRQ